MEVNIRPVKIQDSEDINSMKTMKGVYENMMSIPSERINKTEEFISNLSKNDFAFVAETEEKKVVGFINLTVMSNPRARHAGSFGIMVHKDFQGKGIGKKLLEKIIFLADNYLMLKRIELGVYTDNDRAIALYKSFGFVIEGCKKYSSVRDGKYIDEYIMARYNNIN